MTPTIGIALYHNLEKKIGAGAAVIVSSPAVITKVLANNKVNMSVFRDGIASVVLAIEVPLEQEGVEQNFCWQPVPVQAEILAVVTPKKETAAEEEEVVEEETTEEEPEIEEKTVEEIKADKAAAKKKADKKAAKAKK